ncbi:MAG: DNA-protecting protein DprA, partial [Chloroflexi bacterium]|nr:DNA-protecting protein DprA [Chloroflexota bacterium]
QRGIRVLTWEDPDYPERLRPLPQAPPVLYLRGALTPQDAWAAAVVGTRKMTGYGRRVAEDVAAYLARQGVTVVSGLARGIDGVAHRAALQAGGRTLAVLGSGVDVIYPPEHRALAAAIVEQGALLSEFPPGTRPEGPHFPRRNRLISGLALAMVVVEAGERSGALITATFAAEQGREVFAVPGSIYAATSQGTHWLLQQGAHVLRKPEDLAAVFDMPRLPFQQQARAQWPTDPTERLLWQYLQGEPRHVDELCAETGLPAAQVSALLTLMELKGLVHQVGPMTFVAAGA